MSGGGPTRLPLGWEHKTVRDGPNASRPYYLNHNLGTTHWAPPDPPDAAGSSHSSHPVVMTAASTALVSTHLRQNVEEHVNLSRAVLVILNSFLTQRVTKRKFDGFVQVCFVSGNGQDAHVVKTS